MNKLLFFSISITVMCATSCVAPAAVYLPEVEKIDVNQYGSYIALYTSSRDIIYGELLAIDSNRVTLIEEQDKSFSIQSYALSDIENFKLRYAKPPKHGWSIPVYSLFSITHGWFVVFTLPINLIVTSSITAGGNNSYMYDEEDISYQELTKFARFPQGIPPNIDLNSLLIAD